MSILRKLTGRISTRDARRYAERKLSEYVADQHHAAVMATVRERFPEISGDTIPTALVGAIVRCANRRLLEHML